MYVQRAYALAKKAHLGQKGKGGNDYIEHLKAVASMMDTDIEKAVAYLHDVVEDTKISFDDLKEYGFPNQIIEAVKALTKQKNESYDVYIDRVIKNPIAKKVKLADMKHNSDITRIKNPSQKDYARCQKYLDKIQYLINKPLS